MKPTLFALFSALVVLIGVPPSFAGEEVDLDTLRPGWLGFGFNYSTDGEDTTTLRGRLRVCGVAPGSPAEEAGLEVDDVIMEIDGELFAETRHSDVLLRLARIEPGQTTTFAVKRERTTLEIPVTAGPTTAEQLERWRVNFRLARQQEAQDQELVPRRPRAPGTY